MFLNNRLDFCRDIIISPEVVIAWYFWSIFLLFFLFPINVPNSSLSKYISLMYKKRTTKKGSGALLTILFFQISEKF